MKDKFWRTAVKIVIIGLLVTHLPGAVWAESGIAYSADGSAVVVRYTRTPGELGAPDSSTTLTVYGNGRLLVHYSPYGVRKGDYEMTLSATELDELITTLVDSGIMEYDDETVAIAKQAIMEVDEIGFYVGDADISNIEIELSSYSPEGKATRYDVRGAITASALQMEAHHFPLIESLAKLAAAERELIKLINSDDLSPLR